MSSMNMDDLSGYHVVLEKIVTEKKMLSVTRLLAAELMSNPYKTVGEFFQNINDVDLETIIRIVEEEGGSEHSAELLLMAQMLYGAEGLGSQLDNIDAVTERINQFGVFAIVTSLHRKGLVKVHFENMSFGEDMGDKMLVEKI